MVPNGDAMHSLIIKGKRLSWITGTSVFDSIFLSRSRWTYQNECESHSYIGMLEHDRLLYPYYEDLP